MTSLLISIPCYGGIVSDMTMKGMFLLGKELRTNQIEHGLLTLSNESLITKGRSKIANFFINNTNFEYLLCIDSDVGFAPGDVFKLLSGGKNIVCGAYPKKAIPLRFNYEIEYPEVRDGNLVKINNIGFGFVLIHRSVFHDIIKKYGDELKYIPPMNDSNHPPSEMELRNSYHFFHEMKNGSSYLSEDYSFFKRAKSVGHDAWLDTTISLPHVGSHVFMED